MMRLNKLTDYAIVLMAHVARSPEQALHTARDLAKETRLPLPTVSKLLRVLSERELLESHRGVKGGYTLARDPRRISLAEIILAMEGPFGFTECSASPGLCDMEPSCAMRANSQVIGEALRIALQNIMLSDLNRRLQLRCSKRADNTVVPSICLAEGMR